jgi:predicted ATP-dependent endonuclease of OLD family
MYTTHSPLLVDLRRFHLVRLLREESGEQGKPKCSRIRRATLDQVNRRLEEADGVAPGSYAAEGLEARLQTLMTPWTNEGFFAEVVVLVEGEDDRAAVTGVASVLGHELDSMDTSVIPCQGKTNLHKAAGVFEAFGLPVYTVWDSDEGDQDKKVEDNHRLLRFFGAEVEDHPAVVEAQYACFVVDLETTMRSELGEELYRS